MWVIDCDNRGGNINSNLCIVGPNIIVGKQRRSSSSSGKGSKGKAIFQFLASQLKWLKQSFDLLRIMFRMEQWEMWSQQKNKAAARTTNMIDSKVRTT